MAARRVGADFDAAWNAAIRRVDWGGDPDKIHWKAAFEHTKGGWASAYFGTGTPATDAVAGMAEAEVTVAR